MKAILSAVVLAGLLAAAPACAQDKAAEAQTAEKKACDVPADLLAVGDLTLDKVASAVKDNKKLNVLVVGSASSSISSPDGAQVAYPARLEASLRDKLPGVAVNVASN